MQIEIPDELKGKLTTDVATAARVLGIGRRQAYAAAQAGTITTLKIGSRVLVPVAPLLEALGIHAGKAA
ncbi:hypothetical protein [Agromyces subbeticus]|uniref:hypothetical protein n=1 Tax=Agromyces subbeticus TaxID=293890 RepID=UPI0003B4BBB1|nr:hypothetical protein [Agromyces subbeticus]